MSGYARFHRSLIGHPAFRNDAEAMAFAYMVLRAAWRPVRVRYKGKALSLDRGQLAMSVRDLADAMDRDKGWVERLLKRLKSETMCETRAETGVLVITICNYEKYQAANDGRETDGETPHETHARQTQDTEQVREEGKKEDTPPTPRAGGRRGKTKIPSDWMPPPVAELGPKARACAEQWTPASYETHAEAFVSYWRGCGKMMVDWKDTWGNRVIALHSQVMRDQKFGNAPTAAASAGAATHVTDKAAYLASLAAKPWANRDTPPPVDRRNGNTGPPRSFGQLAAGIAGNA